MFVADCHWLGLISLPSSSSSNDQAASMISLTDSLDQELSLDVCIFTVRLRPSSTHQRLHALASRSDDVLQASPHACLIFSQCLIPLPLRFRLFFWRWVRSMCVTSSEGLTIMYRVLSPDPCCAMRGEFIDENIPSSPELMYCYLKLI